MFTKDNVREERTQNGLEQSSSRWSSVTRHFVWDIDESAMGPGTIEASVRSNEVDPLVDLTLRWTGWNEQPEVWEIRWWHHPDFIRDALPNYLLRFCPVALEMIHALEDLALDNFPTLDDSEMAEPKPSVPARPVSLSRVKGKVAQDMVERIKAAQEGN